MIFLSHRHEDTTIAQHIVELLQDSFEGLRSPESYYLSSNEQFGTPAGNSVALTILERLRKSKIVLVLLTPDWRESTWIPIECAVGIALGSQVIPLVLPGKLPDTMPPFLEDRKRLHLNKKDDLESLVTTVQNQFKLKPNRYYFQKLERFRDTNFAQPTGTIRVVPNTVETRQAGTGLVISQAAQVLLARIRDLVIPEGRVSMSRLAQRCPSTPPLRLCLLNELLTAGVIEVQERRVRLTNDPKAEGQPNR